MTELDDHELLADYARTGSEAAFAVLVARYVNLVHSAAWRFTGNPHHAEEITQAVFIILARKAGGLRRGTVLSGWLYQTARLTAANFVKGEIRRQNREQEAYMQSILTEPEPAAWKQIAPLLDEAMGWLGETDRNAIVLRFFENKTARQVATALKLNEAAAHKRVNRALEKLHHYFARRGVSSTTAIIAGAISAHSVQAAPVALAKAVTSVALAKGAAASGSTLTLIKGALKIMAWTKAKTAVVAGVAVILATGTSLVVINKVHHAPRPVRPAADTYPQTPEELNAWYVEPPAEQNAATYDLQGINAAQTKGADQIANLPILGKLPPPTPSAPLSPAVKSALAAFLQRNRDALQCFAEGAKYEQSRYPIDLTKGADTLLPHLAGVKSGGQLCQMAAILDAENHDGQKAADDVLKTLALARSLQNEPVLISQLVRAVGIFLAADGLNQAVNRTALPSESLPELSKAFKSMENFDAPGEGFTRALVGEKVNHMALLNNREQLIGLLSAPGNFGLSSEQDQQLIKYVNQTGSLKAEQDYLETTFQQLLAARQEAFPDRLKAVSDVIHQRVTEAKSRGLLLNAMYWDGFDNSVVREARCLANVRLALTAVALEQFRAAHGNRYPGALAELAPDFLPAVPVDPFDGQPLRYRKQDAGYVLYSIGPDLKDNGGKQMTAKGGDIVFSVVKPPTP